MTSLKALVLIFAIIYVAQSYYPDHTCDHDEIEQIPQFASIEEDMSSLQSERMLASSGSKLRIYAYFDFLRQSAPSSYAAYIQNELVPPIIDYFQSSLKVKYPVVGNMKLDSNIKQICEKSTPSILRNGVAADYFIYYDSQAISGSQIANSRYCYLSTSTNRPFISRTIINRNMLKVASGDVLIHEQNMYVLMHEMMHTMGFGQSLFNYFLDDNGKARKGHVKSVQVAGRTRTVVDVPPLTERLRKFYGCSSLQGAIMENQGGTGTAGSHFERKFFLYDTMASGSILGRRMTEFTLAFLEGTGWYVPDYSYAEPYFFGQGQGCSFISGTCNNQNPQFDEFCASNTKGCSPTGRGGGFCNTDSNIDGCRYMFPEIKHDCENPDSEDDARLPELQVFGRGAGSRCFTGDLNSRKSSNGGASFCFKYTCNGSGSGTTVDVFVGKNKITCTRAEKRTIDGYYGSVDCPDPLTFCNTVGKKYCPRNCMGRGTCVNNQCQCRSGYSGVDCALRD